jgi:hypothetical protein
MNSPNIFVAAIALLAFVLAGVGLMKSNPDVQFAAFPGTDIYQRVTFYEGLYAPSPAIFPTAATTTLAANESGVTVYQTAATGLTYVLPPASNVGATYRFVVGAAFATSSAVIASAEGDNIDGTLIVAGAVVDCRGEDFINFVHDGEAIGDFVEVTATGSGWVIGASGGLTSAKITCTDPS